MFRTWQIIPNGVRPVTLNVEVEVPLGGVGGPISDTRTDCFERFMRADSPVHEVVGCEGRPRVAFPFDEAERLPRFYRQMAEHFVHQLQVLGSEVCDGLASLQHDH